MQRLRDDCMTLARRSDTSAAIKRLQDGIQSIEAKTKEIAQAEEVNLTTTAFASGSIQIPWNYHQYTVASAEVVAQFRDHLPVNCHDDLSGAFKQISNSVCLVCSWSHTMAVCILKCINAIGPSCKQLCISPIEALCGAVLSAYRDFASFPTCKGRKSAQWNA